MFQVLIYLNPSQETYVEDETGARVLVKPDTRIAAMSEKIVKMRSIIKYERTKLRRLVEKSEKRINMVRANALVGRKDQRYDAIKNLDMHPVVKDLILNEIQIAERKGPANTNRYSDTLKEFCHEIMKISPRAYEFINGFFHFPHRSKIRQYQPNPFAVSTLVPRPKPPKRIQRARVVSPTPPTVIPATMVKEEGIELPTVPLPMDLEENDLMYGLDEIDEVETMYGTANNFVDDDYEDLVLENPPLVEQPFSRPIQPSRVVVDTPSATPAKRRAASTRKAKKRKIEESDDDDDEEDESYSDQPWVKQEFTSKGVQQQQQFHVQQQQQQQIVYNLYANPQPGTSSSASTNPGASMPDIYNIGHDGLKSFDAYYF